METIKLYNFDHYLRQFEAKVLVVDGQKVILDRTLFYPESGGQTGDTGVIGGVKVTNTKIEEGLIVHHLEKTPSIKAGDSVLGEIDWERRYRIMKLHTAAHIMEHFLWLRLGKIERKGSLVDEGKDRADYAYEGALRQEALKTVEEDTNRFLSEGHEVLIALDSDRLWIRHWRCGPVEMLCAGTHVKNTSEVGRIRLKRKNPGRGTERVETYLIEEYQP